MLFDISETERIIGYTFKDKKLLRQCFTHASYSNEHKSEKDNERLEFLGDSVLGLVVANYLFKNTKENEGGMTNRKQQLVSKKPLSNAIKKMGISNHLLIVSQDERTLTDSVKENLFEAIVGGIYLDGGYAKAEEFIFRNLISKMSSEKGEKDNKSALNEYCAKRKLGIPVYSSIKSGQDHNPKFTCKVKIKGQVVAEGIGGSKKIAEQNSAENALKILKSKNGKKKNVEFSKN